MSMRKGILLLAGKGSRLYPSTKVISKHLLQVYDKPMVYYPLSILMLTGIRDILLICNPRDLELFKAFFGNGSSLGINLEYACQEKPLGIADAYNVSRSFLGGNESVLILGDNFFYGNEIYNLLKKANESIYRNTIFLQHVQNPTNFCVAELSSASPKKIISLEEKPREYRSNLAVTGLYFYDKFASDYVKELEFSDRRELEITDLNKVYLDKGKLDYELLGRGITWLDTGTTEALLNAQNFVYTIQQKQGYKIACLEEIAFRNGWITKDEILSNLQYNDNDYHQYIENIIDNIKRYE